VTFYVYALLQDPGQRVTLPSHRLELVRFGDIAAAVERRRTRPAISERALRKQHRCVQQIHDVVDAMLPVRFGALVDRSELERVIDLRRTVLRRALRQVRGKVQMSIREFGRAADQPHVTGPAGSGTDYLRARAAASRPVLSPAADELRRAVRALVSAERLDSGRGALQFSIHHLVGRARLDDYKARVDRAIESAPQLVLSGPWPPFAFAPDLWE
jgi:Gas vesicle synthesis protein GvpL/GvpF